ncbi:zinc finger CCCH domain-containing protein 20-like [Syzygium oleosum]|uniref:zinc finger CCCH domain-containing protein 20-like n=1 Tax=Syzygium oleosum TaxID=219896 RepID=UPI0011D272B8|nr:zinc finger CCCH domain-containing protein 20-like [Syzygium oleosum]
MMIGESRHPLHPTVRIPPPWPSLDDPADEILSQFDADHLASAAAASPRYLQDIIAALRRHQADPDSDGPDSPVDLYTSDQFRMYEFKVRRCTRGKSHDWTECPYAHPGEKARRRDPRRHGYSGAACPDFRSGHCPKGDACELAHGVFECWLHPSRYRTQPCKDGLNCTRRVCFFAHTAEQLRVVPGQQSPRSVESLSSSPPASPMSLSLSRSPFRADPVAEMVASLRNLQLDKVKSMPCGGGSSSGSPRGPRIRPGFYSMPTTPTTQSTPTARGGIGYLDSWESGYEEEPAMERVESGRDLRAKMFEKLNKESSLDTVRPESVPDVWWVSDLVK